jgi:hypothetical protein
MPDQEDRNRVADGRYPNWPRTRENDGRLQHSVSQVRAAATKYHDSPQEQIGCEIVPLPNYSFNQAAVCASEGCTRCRPLANQL